MRGSRTTPKKNLATPPQSCGKALWFAFHGFMSRHDRIKFPVLSYREVCPKPPPPFGKARRQQRYDFSQIVKNLN